MSTASPFSRPWLRPSRRTRPSLASTLSTTRLVSRAPRPRASGACPPKHGIPFFQALAAALEKNATVAHINLGYNGIGDEGAKARSFRCLFA